MKNAFEEAFLKNEFLYSYLVIFKGIDGEFHLVPPKAAITKNIFTFVTPLVAVSGFYFFAVFCLFVLST